MAPPSYSICTLQICIGLQSLCITLGENLISSEGQKEEGKVLLLVMSNLIVRQTFELQLLLRRAVFAYKHVSKYISTNQLTLVIAYCALKCF